MPRLVVFTTALLLTFGCEEEAPCDRWADYVCACHEGEEGFDCEELRALAEAPSATVTDQCAIDLEDQRADDQANEVACEL